MSDTALMILAVVLAPFLWKGFGMLWSRRATPAPQPRDLLTDDDRVQFVDVEQFKSSGSFTPADWKPKP